MVAKTKTPKTEKRVKADKTTFKVNGKTQLSPEQKAKLERQASNAFFKRHKNGRIVKMGSTFKRMLASASPEMRSVLKRMFKDAEYHSAEFRSKAVVTTETNNYGGDIGKITRDVVMIKPKREPAEAFAIA